MVHQKQDTNQNEHFTDNSDEETPFTLTEGSNGHHQPNEDTVADGQKNSENVSEHLRQNDKDVPFLTKFKYNKIYREKYFITLAIMWAFLVLGWTIGQFGPSFLDLQIITGVTLKEGSGFMTGHAVGYLIGSIIFGIVFDKMTGEKTYLVSFSMLAVGVIIAIIPWCAIYELMIGIHVFKGIAGGALDTTGNALLISLWGSDGKSFMQALHFAFGVGGIASPFAIAPFLAPEENTTTQLTTATPISFSNTTSDFNELITPRYNESKTNNSSSDFTSYESQLYIAFSITAGLAVSAAVPLFVMSVLSKRKSDKEDSSQTEEERRVRKLTRWKKVFVLALLMSFIGIYCAMEDGFNGFLATFCVKGMAWTKYEGSVITSVFWASFSAVRFLGIFFVRIFKPVHMIFFMSICLCIGFVVFLLSGTFNIDEGIWVSACITGCAMSIIFPSLFTWADESILPVSGVVASCFLIAASCGAMINPIILGFLMDNYTPMWFPYILLGESVLMIILLLVSWAIARRLRIPKHTFQEVEVEIRCGEEDEIDYRSIIAESELNDDRL